jgi:putative hemolysin
MDSLGLLILVFLFGIYFSAMETVYTSFDRILVLGWLKSRRLGARAVEFLSSKPERFLGTTLLGNNLTNVAYSSLLVLLAENWHLSSVWLLTASPIIVLIFSEILPKMIGLGLANRIICPASLPLLGAYYLFTPFRLLMLPVTRILVRKSDPNEEAVSGETFSLRRELDQILVGAEEEGAANPGEGELLERYIDARELKARQIMTPRTQLKAVNIEASSESIRDIFRKSHYNVLPVYRNNLDHIVGYVKAQDFLADVRSIHEVLKPIHAVPESKRLVDLLQEFKHEQRQIALVIDEYGGTDGLVTLKDIFEELVGPVSERFNADRPVIRRISSRRYLASGMALLENIELTTGWEPPEKESLTLSGLLADHLGRIADVGEEVDFDGVIVRVLRKSPRRVEGCLIKLPIPSDEDED